MSVPRIIFVNRVFWPATEATAQLLHDLVEELVRSGLAVTVVTATPSPAGAEALHSSEPTSLDRPTVLRIGSAAAPGNGPRKTGLIAKTCGYLSFLKQARATLAQIVCPGDIVVAMTDPPMLGTIISSVALKRGAKMWHWVQDLYPEVALAIAPFGPLTALLGFFKGPRDRSWRAASQIITLGTDMAERIRSRGVNADRIAVIPNWAPAGLDHSGIERLRERWNCPQDSFVLAYSGNLGRAHALQGLIDLAAQLDSDRRIQFRIIGEGAQKQELQAATTRLRLSNCAFLPPAARSDLGSSLAAANLHFITMRPTCAGTVWPSKFYGIVAAGRPMVFIGPATAEVAQVITKQGLGLAVEPSDQLRVVDFVKQLASSPEIYAEFCGKVIAFARTTPDAARAAIAWRKLIADRAITRVNPSGPNR